MWFVSVFHTAATSVHISCPIMRNEWRNEWKEKCNPLKKDTYGLIQSRDYNSYLLPSAYASSWHIYSCLYMFIENSSVSHCTSSGIKSLKHNMSISLVIQCYLYRNLSSWGFSMLTVWSKNILLLKINWIQNDRLDYTI